MTYRRKLIEVALPLEAINRESAREKSIRHGHPSTLHLWWARRPLAACRAVLFASIVDDPSSRPEEFRTEESQEAERKRLFSIIEELVTWESYKKPAVLAAARAEIMKATKGNPPPVLDPFCGGGSIPLEAQRLGLDAFASDLNPVAVLITKALIEIPPRFSGLGPVHPDAEGRLSSGGWTGARGMADDIRYYGQWMREEAFKRIGHLYPRTKLPKEHGGAGATVIAWLWARTVRCPNPACGLETPLLTSFTLSAKKGRERYLRPIIEGKRIQFDITEVFAEGQGDPKKGYKRGTSGVFECAFCGTVTTRDYVAGEGVAGRLGMMQTAVVAQGNRMRVFLRAESSIVDLSAQPEPDIRGLDAPLALNPRDVWCRNFGLKTVDGLFTKRQLIALTALSDLVTEARGMVVRDAVAAGFADNGARLSDGGEGAEAYGDGVATYLAFVVDRVADRHSTIATWDASPTKLQLRNTFARQAIPMTWDFAEGNLFGSSSGAFGPSIEWVASALETVPGSGKGICSQANAADDRISDIPALVVTDPPTTTTSATRTCRTSFLYG